MLINNPVPEPPRTQEDEEEVHTRSLDLFEEMHNNNNNNP